MICECISFIFTIYIYIYIYTFTKDCFWRQSYVFSPWIWGPQKNVGTSKCSQIQCGLFFYMVDLTRSWNAFLNHVPKNFFLSSVMSLRPCWNWMLCPWFLLRIAFCFCFYWQRRGSPVTSAFPQFQWPHMPHKHYVIPGILFLNKKIR